MSSSYETLKEGMALCTGERTKGYASACRGHLYKCPSCGNVGCRQSTDDACTAQGFDLGFRCTKCNTTVEAEALSVNYTQTQPWLHPEAEPAH